MKKREEFRFELDVKDFTRGSEKFLVKLMETTKFNLLSSDEDNEIKFVVDVLISNRNENKDVSMLRSDIFQLSCDRGYNFEMFEDFYQEISSDLDDYCNYKFDYDFVKEGGLDYYYLVFHVAI